jgi:glycosyltransferase involved in cell wall biosynthesis
VKPLRLSAIVSTYNSAIFLKGCLDNLTKQSLYATNNLEIIVIDSGSEENEKEIVHSFQKNHGNINYLRTEKRESLYQAWNRGVTSSKGKYLTNANTDDRHDVNCLERLVDHLEQNLCHDGAYGNLYQSIVANETFDQNDKSKPCYAQTFFPGSLLLHNYIGAQPVWRKSLHEKVGLFDKSYEVIGDYEFILRSISNGSKFFHVPEAEGTMLWHEKALSARSQNSIVERKNLLSKYVTKEGISSIYNSVLTCNKEEIQNDANLDLGIRSLCYYPQFANDLPQFDFEWAKRCFSSSSKSPALLHNLQALKKIDGSETCGQDNVKTLQSKLLFYGPSEKLLLENELKKIKPHYLTHKGEQSVGGRLHQVFSFSVAKFHNFLFGHLPVDELCKFSVIHIYGFNQRGRLLGNWLRSKAPTTVKFWDSNPHNLGNSTYEVRGFHEIKVEDNSAFILAMSSHHWRKVTLKIRNLSEAVPIYALDRA